jgi:hypothetical protein
LRFRLARPKFAKFDRFDRKGFARKFDGRKNFVGEINAYEPRVAQMSSLAEFMRPAAKSKTSVVNETMNAVMAALSRLDAEISREMFQDRISDSLRSEKFF